MKKKTKQNLIVIGAIALFIIGGIVWQATVNRAPGELDAFAACLGERGTTFYGAFWCPACNEQKRMFGNSERLLPYVECSTPDRQGQLPVCQDADISSYPTWEFADGSRLTGAIPLPTLSEKTGCELPAEG